MQLQQPTVIWKRLERSENRLQLQSRETLLIMAWRYLIRCLVDKQDISVLATGFLFAFLKIELFAA